MLAGMGQTGHAFFGGIAVRIDHPLASALEDNKDEDRSLAKQEPLDGLCVGSDYRVGDREEDAEGWWSKRGSC